MSKYQRYQPAITRSSDESISEDHWLKKFEKSLQKGAVQPKVQQSLFDQINSIMNRTSRHPSVEAAVEDMKERSGLTAYLTKVKRAEVEESDASVVKHASNEQSNEIVEALKVAVKTSNWRNVGKLMADMELIEGDPATNAMDNIVSFKYFHDPELKHVKVPINAWNDFTIGYCEGRGMDEERTAKQLEFTRKIAEKHGKKFASDNNEAKKNKMPAVIQKFPGILKTLQNCIRDTKGNLPLPAIIERVRSIHQGDVSEAKDWDQDDLMYLVSQMNLDAKRNNPSTYQDYSNLGGRDVASDSEIDPSNTDAFNALMPAK
jgi:hypothetical protein